MPTLAILIDESSGEEIVVFTRKGKTLAFLRNKITKRFIKRVRGTRVKVIVTFSSQGAKDNPLYVDATGMTTILDTQITDRDDIARRLSFALFDAIQERFGEVVADLVNVVGVEYKITAELPTYPDADIDVIWAHKYNKREEKVRLKL